MITYRVVDGCLAAKGEWPKSAKGALAEAAALAAAVTLPFNCEVDDYGRLVDDQGRHFRGAPSEDWARHGHDGWNTHDGLVTQ